MSNKTPNDDSPELWTLKRCEQLGKLDSLFHCIRLADKGSSFIRNFKKAEKLVEELSTSEFPDRSFIEFLSDIAIANRREHKKQFGKLP